MLNYKRFSLIIAISITICMLTVGCTKPIAPVNSAESQTNEPPDVSSNPTSSPAGSPSPSIFIETYKDETHKQIQYGKLSFEIDSYFHIVYHARSDDTETFKCETDKDVTWQPVFTMTFVAIREMEKQYFTDTEGIAAYLRDLSPNYERIRIYHDVTDDSGIVGLYSVTGGGLTNYIVSHQDACYFIESDYCALDNDLFIHYHEANYKEDKLKIECADSFITDVNQTVYYHKDEFVKAEYDITQGKDGTKYAAELIRDDGYHFTLQNENGENLLTLSTYGSFYDILKFVDLNTDGYADVQFLEEPGTWNNSYALYVWDETSKNFIKVKCDEMLSHIEVRDDYLLNWQKENYESGVVQKLIWDKYTLIKESEKPYYLGE
jgi:hypothetical protein